MDLYLDSLNSSGRLKKDFLQDCCQYSEGKKIDDHSLKTESSEWSFLSIIWNLINPLILHPQGVLLYC